MNWEDLWKETTSYLPHENKEINDLHQEISTWFTQMTPSASNFGLTHGDHRPGNVLSILKSLLLDFMKIIINILKSSRLK